jgi:hypothetical protein
MGFPNKTLTNANLEQNFAISLLGSIFQAPKLNKT